MPDVSTLTQAYLTSRDGAVTRTGKAMTRLAATTGYSVETLRSIAYGRRNPAPGLKRTKLLRAVRRG